MIEYLTKLLTVALLSSLKFMTGPIAATVMGLQVFETIVASVIGMMATISAFTFGGAYLKKTVLGKYFDNKKKFTTTNRMFVKVWKRFGLLGIAILTPPLFTPPLAGILVNLVNVPRRKILLNMLISAIIWGTIITLSLKYFYDYIPPEVLNWIGADE